MSLIILNPFSCVVLSDFQIPVCLQSAAVTERWYVVVDLNAAAHARRLERKKISNTHIKSRFDTLLKGGEGVKNGRLGLA